MKKWVFLLDISSEQQRKADMKSNLSSTCTDLVCPLWKVIYTIVWVNTWLLSHWEAFKATKAASLWKLQYCKTAERLKLPGGEDEPLGFFSLDCCALRLDLVHLQRKAVQVLSSRLTSPLLRYFQGVWDASFCTQRFWHSAHRIRKVVCLRNS